jgi:hypothetical protein
VGDEADRFRRVAIKGELAQANHALTGGVGAKRFGSGFGGRQGKSNA